MKTIMFRRVKQAASALLTALVICSIFSLFAVYYLSLVEQQNFLNTRSQTWNMAIAITEAGVEEGLENLNENSASLGTAPWSFIGNNTYYRSNTLPDGSSYTVFITNAANPIVVSRAYVVAGNSMSLSQNLSAGFFAAAGGSSAPTTLTRAVQVNTTRTALILAPLVARKNINLNGNNIATDSYSSCDPTKSINGQYAPGFYSGDHGDIASNLGVIDSISGGNANVYGHAHTGVNTNGQPTVAIGPNGAVGSHAWQANNKGLQPGWVLEDANFTFPDTTFPSTSGYLTATGGVLVVTSNAVTSWSTNSSNYPGSVQGGVATNLVGYVTSATYPSPAPPGVTTNYLTMPVSKSSIYPAPGTYVGSVSVSDGGTKYSYNQIIGIASYNVPTYTYTYSLYATNLVYCTNSYNTILWGTTDLGQTNNYVANSLSGQTLVVGDNVNLALPNGLSMAGNDAITIMPFANVVGAPSAPPGANVTVYCGGTSCTIGGNGVINQPGYPADFILLCAPTVTSFALNGNGGFNGVLVAPSVDLTLNGSGTTPIDFVGAAMVNSATLNGHFHFHYDECLANYKNNPRFLITAWNEIP